jgi:hypothetical protein
MQRKLACTVGMDGWTLTKTPMAYWQLCLVVPDHWHMIDYRLIGDADLDRAEERALVRVQAALDALRAHEAATEAAAVGRTPASQAQFSARYWPRWTQPKRTSSRSRMSRGAVDSRTADIEPERRLGEDGLAEALDRLDERALDRETYEHLIPFAEALSWVYALHEWHKHSMHGQPFFDQMRATDDGKTVLAIAWVRARVQHYLDDVTKILTTGGSFIPMPIGTIDSQVGTAGRPELRWQTLQGLGNPTDRGHRHEYYRDFVGGKPLVSRV